MIILIHQLLEATDLVTVYNTVDSFWGNKETGDEGLLLLALLEELTKEKNELCDKISPFLASQSMVKDNNSVTKLIISLGAYKWCGGF